MVSSRASFGMRTFARRERVQRALALLSAHGAAVVLRNPSVTTPAEDEMEALIDAFSEAGLRVIGTHFGRTSFQVRWSYFTLAPYRLPFERMEASYRAHDRFARLVRDQRNQYRFGLATGDFIIYDNYRMMHRRRGRRSAERAGYAASTSIADARP